MQKENGPSFVRPFGLPTTNQIPFLEGQLAGILFVPRNKWSMFSGARLWSFRPELPDPLLVGEVLVNQ